VRAGDGRSLSFEQISLWSLHCPEPAPIAATTFFPARDSPPAFAAAFAEVEVDTETGVVRVLRLVEAVDAAPVGDPRAAQAQVQGDAVQSLGYALLERSGFRSLREYTMAAAVDVPQVVAILPPGRPPLETKGMGEVTASAVAPAIANAVAHATGVRVRDLPFTPDRVLDAIERGAE
jgi:CO/xanthine dehydrogenase Mo-binding subunit